MKLKEIAKDPEYGRFDFISKWPILGGVSFLAVVLSFVLFATKGFNYGVDFAGGTEVQVKFEKPVPVEDIRKFVGTIGYENASVQSLGEDNEFLIRTDINDEDLKNEAEAEKLNEDAQKTAVAISTGLTEKFVDYGPVIRRVDTVGPQVGAELKKNGVLAAFYSLIAILLYITLRFDYKFAPAAVICLFHDAVVTLGLFSLLGKEVNLQTLAAVLTIIGYSINDTIINFDRVRENMPVYKNKPLALIINRSVNDVLSRTIITTLVTLLSVLPMYFFTSGVIQDIAFTLLVGIIAGGYSTMYVASPMVLLFDKVEKA